MRCDVCGQDFLTEHPCQGPAETSPDFSLFYYLREGWRIVRWDDAAIRRIKDDKRVLPYGILIWFLANAIPFLIFAYIWPEAGSSYRDSLLSVAFGLLSAAIMGVLQMGTVHLFAKYFCAGDGRLIQILRPLLLASFIFVFEVIPVAGFLVSGIAWVCVMVMVFDVVDGMPQMTAFLVAAGARMGLGILATQLFKLWRVANPL